MVFEKNAFRVTDERLLNILNHLRVSKQLINRLNCIKWHLIQSFLNRFISIAV